MQGQLIGPMQAYLQEKDRRHEAALRAERASHQLEAIKREVKIQQLEMMVEQQRERTVLEQQQQRERTARAAAAGKTASC